MKPNLPATPTDAQRLDALRQTMRDLIEKGDVGSVKEMAKDAYAYAARLRNELRPHEMVFGAATEVLMQHLLREGRMAVNDSEFTIELSPEKKIAVTDSDKLYDMLHAMRIDDEPLPPELLREAAYIDIPVPPPPTKKTNLTKIKPLVKRFGKVIEDALTACVTYREQPRQLIFAPKEKALDGE
jgi:hypothetical protein